MSKNTTCSSTSKAVRAEKQGLSETKRRWLVPENKPTWVDCWWLFLHTSASFHKRAPSAEEKRRMRLLIESAIACLPCEETCRPHAIAYLHAHPPSVDSRRECEDWVIGLHNDVSARLGRAPLDGQTARRQQKRLRQLNLPAIAADVFTPDAAGGSPDVAVRSRGRSRRSKSQVDGTELPGFCCGGGGGACDS